MNLIRFVVAWLLQEAGHYWWCAVEWWWKRRPGYAGAETLPLGWRFYQWAMTTSFKLDREGRIWKKTPGD